MNEKCLSHFLGDLESYVVLCTLYDGFNNFQFCGIEFMKEAYGQYNLGDVCCSCLVEEFGCIKCQKNMDV